MEIYPERRSEKEIEEFLDLLVRALISLAEETLEDERQQKESKEQLNQQPDPDTHETQEISRQKHKLKKRKET